MYKQRVKVCKGRVNKNAIEKQTKIHTFTRPLTLFI